MTRLFNLIIEFIIIITGIITTLILYPLFLSTSNGAIFIVVILIPLLFGIAGIGWILGGWVGVGAAIEELGLRFRIWLLMHLLYGDREFLIDLLLIQYMLMNVYRVPHELAINGREVTIKAPLSKDAGIRLMNYLNQRLNKLIIIDVESMEKP
ncbi:hypothetical protein VMUT_1191 [Vulcanisaeta moutnovskia 768-28]|uniref:Uncharacterized protein n=1 Tax=Vulcanisaeta moutnovskia (strain 768-28) TaxID=985053 RepID=F0QYG3_VULM7|nr:hypothetical protein [Vulcanisaeta moutnovskia]ADY01396.1 hypothetical protein VMUT_1191 [Vulcanisaeta moutnovskia 768-28]